MLSYPSFFCGMLIIMRGIVAMQSASVGCLAETLGVSPRAMTRRDRLTWTRGVSDLHHPSLRRGRMISSHMASVFPHRPDPDLCG